MTSTIGRAFVLARTGDFATIKELKAALRKEHHENIDAHLDSPSLKRQLLAILATTRNEAAT